MTADSEQWRRLEQQISQFFAANGYRTWCNEVREGKSGGRHEIDVFAEKADPLTTYQVAIECKAWQTPIDKDVVSKLEFVVRDLGLSKGIVVSLAGCRSGAQRAAASLGIDLWGPDELRRHLGEAAYGALTVPSAPSNQTFTWGRNPTVSATQAKETLASSGKGRFNLRTLERLVWMSPVWLPVHCVRISVAQPETRLMKTRLRSVTVDNLYDALTGGFLGRAGAVPWERVQVDQRTQLRPVYRDTKVHASIRKALESYQRVTSEAAVARHAAYLAGLGIPTPCHTISIDNTSLVYLPYYAGILQAGAQERVAAVDAGSGRISEVVSEALTSSVSHLRVHFS